MRLCGIDEAGRGPLAGPVTAAAVVLSRDFPVEQLADSKRLTPGRRAGLEHLIKNRAFCWGVGWASHREIDELNILQASHLAMTRAVTALASSARLTDAGFRLGSFHAIVDGSVVPHLPLTVRAEIRADGSVPEVMAASILAKQARDRWMVAYARIDPRYHFEQHKGYPTREHRALIRQHGPSAIHRYSFRSA
jgi:ribonuclease HII